MNLGEINTSLHFGGQTNPNDHLYRKLAFAQKDLAILFIDTAGKLVEWNSAAELLYEYTGEELAFIPFRSLYPESTSSTDYEQIVKLIPLGSYVAEVLQQTKKGNCFRARMSFMPIYEHGELQIISVTVLLSSINKQLDAKKHQVLRESAADHTNIAFNKLIEKNYSGKTLLNSNLQIIYRNPSAIAINGWGTSELEQLTFVNIIHPDDRKAVLDVINAVKSDASELRISKFRCLHSQGYYIWLECSFFNLLEEDSVNAIVCTFRDITKQINAEELLQKTMQELYAYKYALDKAAIVAITDHKGKIEYVNEQFCKLSGFSEQELEGKDHSIVNSAYHDVSFMKDLWKTIGRGGIWKGEIKNKNKQGEYYWVDTTIVPFLNKNGKPDKYLAIRFDITNRKLMEEKLIADAQFITGLTDSMPVISSYWSGNLKCLFANQACRKWLGGSTDVLHGVSFDTLLRERGYEDLIQYTLEAANGQEQHVERYFKGDNGDRCLYFNFRPHQQGGESNAFYCLGYDVTDIKLAAKTIAQQNAQIEGLLDTMEDGYIALDSNLCYTYVNKQAGQLLQRDVTNMVGKYIWDLFPDIVGSATYNSIQLAHQSQKQQHNEDYYEALGLWQENRIYPTTGGGLSIFITDISERKKNEQHLKLLESVIVQSNDAVMIVSASRSGIMGLRVEFVNKAFSEMTGYQPEDVMNRVPRFLWNAKTDVKDFKTFMYTFRGENSYEATLSLYKKDKTHYWGNITVSPVLDSNGRLTHWICIQRDVTKERQSMLRGKLFNSISHIFNISDSLNACINKTLGALSSFAGLRLAEIWLVNASGMRIGLKSRYMKQEKPPAYYEQCIQRKSFEKGGGLPGEVWVSGMPRVFKHINELGNDCSLSVFPLRSGHEVIGVMVTCAVDSEEQKDKSIYFWERAGKLLGTKIHRRQMAQDLHQIFTFAPDILCIASTDGFFKKVNPAMCSLLGYTEEELLTQPIVKLIHPADKEQSFNELARLAESTETFYFENRCLTKTGSELWLSWTASRAPDDKLIYVVARDITDKKNLQKLLDNAYSLSRIGGWEIDLVHNTVFWSDVTRNIHETVPDFQPTLENGLAFYKVGESRDSITTLLKGAMENGTPFDVELQIITGKGNLKWIRVIGEPEFVNDTCVRIYGSFQDVNARKTAELDAKKALMEKNTILESIGDAFIAIDDQWNITYWNSTAEKLMQKSRAEVLYKNLWELFQLAEGTAFYKKCHHAMATGIAEHFEEYYAPFATWYEVSAYPSSAGLSVFFKDVTERQSYIKAVELQNDTLREISWIQSHKVRAPLTKIMGLVSLLSMKEPDEESEKMLGYLVQSATELDDMVKSIVVKSDSYIKTGEEIISVRL